MGQSWHVSLSKACCLKGPCARVQSWRRATTRAEPQAINLLLCKLAPLNLLQGAVNTLSDLRRASGAFDRVRTLAGGCPLPLQRTPRRHPRPRPGGAPGSFLRCGSDWLLTVVRACEANQRHVRHAPAKTTITLLICTSQTHAHTCASDQPIQHIPSYTTLAHATTTPHASPIIPPLIMRPGHPTPPPPPPQVRSLVQTSDPDPSMYGALPPGAWWEVANGAQPVVEPYAGVCGCVCARVCKRLCRWDHVCSRARGREGTNCQCVYGGYSGPAGAGLRALCVISVQLWCVRSPPGVRCMILCHRCSPQRWRRLPGPAPASAVTAHPCPHSTGI
jgi:hypothetical protein